MYRALTLQTVLVAALSLLAVPVWAADEVEVVPTLTARKVIVQADGKEVLEAADRALPGEIIEYQVVYKNKGKTDVAGLQATLPVPVGMDYLPGTSRPVSVMASVDGEKFDAVPLRRRVKLPDGREQIHDVPYTEYRFLRWDVGNLAGGKSAKVTARVQVSPVGVTSAAQAQ
jgi:uncharacterized repeat protein (TIGR01451 family)